VKGFPTQGASGRSSPWTNNSKLRLDKKTKLTPTPRMLASRGLHIKALRKICQIKIYHTKSLSARSLPKISNPKYLIKALKS